MTRSRAGLTTNRISILGKGNGFVFSPKCPNQFRGPPNFLFNRHRELPQRGQCVKMNSPEVSAEFRLVSGTIPSSPARLYGVHRNTFTSIFLLFYCGFWGVLCVWSVSQIVEQRLIVAARVTVAGCGRDLGCRVSEDKDGPEDMLPISKLRDVMKSQKTRMEWECEIPFCKSIARQNITSVSRANDH